MPFAIPLEGLGGVLIFDVFAFELVLLEKLVDWPITTAPARDVHQLIVVPVLREDALRPGLLPPEKHDDFL